MTTRIPLVSLIVLLAVLACFNPCLAYYNGIDVPKWQATINWTQVHSAGISFAFAKATEGYGYTDPKFQTNIEGAHGVGLLVGPYHFARPDLNPDEAVDEADWFVSEIGDYLVPGYLRPVLDLEKGSALGKTALSAWVCDFTARVKELTGLETIIYCNTNYAKNYLNSTVTGKDLWIANWTYDTTQSPGTGVWSSWDFWQWSNQGTVSGISTLVDLDVCRAHPVTYAIRPWTPGDANRDAVVNDLDASILAAHWQQTSGAAWTDGDFNGDARVTDLDASILAAHWQGGAAAVPEPAGWVLIAAVAVVWPLLRRGQFMDRSRALSAGWIGFYWGKTPEECRRSDAIADAITLGWLELFQQRTPRRRASRE